MYVYYGRFTLRANTEYIDTLIAFILLMSILHVHVGSIVIMICDVTSGEINQCNVIGIYIYIHLTVPYYLIKATTDSS